MKDKDIMHLLQAKKREAEEKSGYHISLMVLKGSQNVNALPKNISSVLKDIRLTGISMEELSVRFTTNRWHRLLIW